LGKLKNISNLSGDQTLAKGS